MSGALAASPNGLLLGGGASSRPALGLDPGSHRLHRKLTAHDGRALAQGFELGEGDLAR